MLETSPTSNVTESETNLRVRVRHALTVKRIHHICGLLVTIHYFKKENATGGHDAT
jgi:hypothetical protein